MATTKFDIRTEAARPFFATVGATDLALRVAVQAAADLQDRVESFEPTKYATRSFELKDFDVASLSIKAQSYAGEAKRAQAAFESRVKGMRFDTREVRGQVKAAQTRFETRMTELQAEVMALPGRAQKAMAGIVAEAGDTYAGLAERGEKALAQIRRGEYRVATPVKEPVKESAADPTAGPAVDPAPAAPETQGDARVVDRGPAVKKAAPAKKATAKKAPAKKAPAKKTPAKKAPAKKAAAKKAAAESAPAKKAAAAEAPAQKAAKPVAAEATDRSNGTSPSAPAPTPTEPTTDA